MVKVFKGVFVLSLLCSLSSYAVQLRTGFEANQERVDGVWKSLGMMNLEASEQIWSACKECIAKNEERCSLNGKLDEARLSILKAHGVADNAGSVDQETMQIINASYRVKRHDNHNETIRRRPVKQEYEVEGIVDLVCFPVNFARWLGRVSSNPNK